MTWERGRATIDRLLAARELEMVEVSPLLAKQLVMQARAHMASARMVEPVDPEGAYQLAYDAARKACSALLAVQGLRATTRGGHRAVQEAVVDQFDGPSGSEAFRGFGRLRRLRAQAEYPGVGHAALTPEDVSDGVAAAARVVADAAALLKTQHVTPFRP